MKLLVLGCAIAALLLVATALCVVVYVLLPIAQFLETYYEEEKLEFSATRPQ
jgi:hypothetical protein